MTAPDPEAIRAHNLRQLSHFDIDAASNPRMRPADTPYVHRHVDRLVDFAGLTTEQRILDIGCGMGKFTIPMAQRGFDVEGLDLSPVLLEEFRRHPDASGIVMHEADILDPPVELVGAFDAVVGFFMLHHLVDVAAAFTAMRALLRPGGRVAFLEPNGLCPLYYLQVTFTPGMSWRGDGGIPKMTARRLTAALHDAGYAEIRSARLGMLPPQLANRPGADRWEDRLDEVRIIEPVRAFQLVTGVVPASA